MEAKPTEDDDPEAAPPAEGCTAPHPGVSFLLSLATIAAAAIVTALAWRLLH